MSSVLFGPCVSFLRPESIPEFLHDPVPEALWCEHSHIGHPGQDPPHEFLASRCLPAHFDPTIHTFGEYLDFHPHLHMLLADGLFVGSGLFYLLPDVSLKPFSLDKMQVNEPDCRGLDGSVIYRSAMNVKIQRNFEVFTPSDFIAAITQHIPEKSFQLVRYYGWYSNKMRGQRDKRAAGTGRMGHRTLLR